MQIGHSLVDLVYILVQRLNHKRIILQEGLNGCHLTMPLNVSGQIYGTQKGSRIMVNSEVLVNHLYHDGWWCYVFAQEYQQNNWTTIYWQGVISLTKIVSHYLHILRIVSNNRCHYTSVVVFNWCDSFFGQGGANRAICSCMFPWHRHQWLIQRRLPPQSEWCWRWPGCCTSDSTS